jgi:hypothetical protein
MAYAHVKPTASIYECHDLPYAVAVLEFLYKRRDGKKRNTSPALRCCSELLCWALELLEPELLGNEKIIRI